MNPRLPSTAFSKGRAVAHAAATAILAAALFPTAAFLQCAALTREQTAGEEGVR